MVEGDVCDEGVDSPVPVGEPFEAPFCKTFAFSFRKAIESPRGDRCASSTAEGAILGLPDNANNVDTWSFESVGRENKTRWWR